MTWLWVKKRRARTTLLFLAFTLTTFLHFTAADDVATNTTSTNTTTTTDGGTGGGGGGGGGDSNSSDYKAFLDLTKFVNSLNDWDFIGAWAKYDLSQLSEEVRPLPLVPDAEDQGVLICQTLKIPGTLQKDFPPLHNATFSLTYFANASNGKLIMTGEVVGPTEATKTLFNYSVPGDWVGHPEGKWSTDTFQLPDLAAQGDFKIRVIVQRDKGEWAAAEIKVEGVTGPPITTTTAPPTTAPQTNLTNVTTPVPNVNQTETTTSKINGTTAAPPNTTTTSTSTTTEDAGGELSRLESVAQAVWDAFYVFLALFCACLVALVALIVHGRCKDDEPPPAVATYNPRTASYRMDKVYDNPSYDNNAV